MRSAVARRHIGHICLVAYRVIEQQQRGIDNVAAWRRIISALKAPHQRRSKRQLEIKRRQAA